MANHEARVTWDRNGEPFLKGQFSREHRWSFDGGLAVVASASPHVVKVPFSNPAGIDPEEAFVASLSSCHMLTFLWHASRGGFVCDSYEDSAVGILGKNAEGRFAVTKVTLKPKAVFSGDKQPSREELDHLHHLAHEECFIANSVKTEITCEPQ